MPKRLLVPRIGERQILQRRGFVHDYRVQLRDNNCFSIKVVVRTEGLAILVLARRMLPGKNWIFLHTNSGHTKSIFVNLYLSTRYLVQIMHEFSSSIRIRKRIIPGMVQVATIAQSSDGHIFGQGYCCVRESRTRNLGEEVQFDALDGVQRTRSYG